VRLCAFDLDHTLVRTPLDLAAMAADMRAHLEGAGVRLPARDDRYRVGELLRFCKDTAPALEAALWSLALEREQRAMDEATLEPGARAAVAGARRLGFVTALWTNNAGAVTRAALARLELADHFDVVVTRDDMRELKPHPDGWRVIAGLVAVRGEARSGAEPSGEMIGSVRGEARSGAEPSGEMIGSVRGEARSGAEPSGEMIGMRRGVPASSVRTYMVGDSWVDGLAAAAAGVPFIAYRANPADLARWKIEPVVTLTDLAGLPDWLSGR
jgi:phosphoglycolate phosphatase-like HAD superfamily hydrolase